MVYYFEFDYCSLVIIKVTVVWCRKYCNNSWKFLRSRPFIHFESFSLSLMCPNHRNHFIFLKESASELTTKKIWASSHLICLNNPFTKSTFIIDWICPHEITEKAIFRYLPKAINFSDIVKLYYEKDTVFSSCDIPPWRARNFLFIKQAKGNWSNISIVKS